MKAERFYVRVRPNAPQTELLEVLEDESWKIAVAAPPREGRANEALLRFLAKKFAVPRSQVRIISGGQARMKLVEVSLDQGS